MQLKKILLNGKVIILVLFLLFAVLAVNPRPFNEGAAIRSVDVNSSASIAGMVSPKANAPPVSREIITAIDNEPIRTLADYYSKESDLVIGEPVQLKTSKGLYKLITKEKNGQPNLGIVVFDAPKSNLRLGLDLQGGTRIILEPAEKISNDDLDILLSNLNERLNVYGLSDLSIRPTSDLEGKKYILIEVAGGNDQEVINLVGKQGKFEAKVANVSVFKGGDDITYVCRSADCSGLSPYSAPKQISETEWSSSFQFSISLSNEAAERMAEATRKLTVVGEYLSEPIYLYLDDQLVDQLQIGSSLKGQATTDISISGPGLGTTLSESQSNALQAMKKLQTILITGSLPVKLNIVKTDTISPVLGKEFIQNAVKMLFFAIIGVTLVILFRYRKPAIVIPILITTLSEVTLTLGTMSLFGANLDVAAIAGILVAIGTGVNDQIIIMDELTLKQKVETNWLKRMKNAFFIIVAAYLTAVSSMIPLLFAGAGLLKGFAITSIVGVTVGVLITRPAFAAIVERILRDEQEE